ncbi:MAG: 50S ribosomal protein L13 [Patescibacteria group bacterium]|nr:MAG: 50S ribosomal protein L13 [Patescibacteria group bacterium]
MANKLTETTRSVKLSEVKRDWHLIDLKNKVLGREAGRIAQLLQGKNKVNYVANLDMGDYVVVINAKRLKLTGSKTQKKEYQSYSGYPGGLKVESFKSLINRKPEEVVKRAVSGMLPKNKLRKRRLARLYIFADENHNFGDKFNKNN